MRLKLVRGDGRTYMERWGFELPGNRGGVYLHHLPMPDPGWDLHDHPYNFWSIILRGGYIETVNSKYTAIYDARQNTSNVWHPRGKSKQWMRWSLHRMTMDECHRIDLLFPHTWTLVIRGPRKQEWGFYTPDGWIHEDKYSRDRRDLVNAV